MRLEHTLDKILSRAFKESMRRKHEYFTPEHVLYAALFFDETREMIENCGGDIKKIKKDLLGYFSEHMKVMEGGEPLATVGLNSVLQISASHVLSSGRENMEIGDVFAAMLEQEESFAAYYLQKNGVSRLNILRYISHGDSLLPEAEAEEGEDPKEAAQPDVAVEEEDREDDSEESSNAGRKNILKKFTVDLVQKARKGEVDPLIGREDILQRTIQILSRRTKNNPIHVGDPGVGKTAIVEGLALAIAEGKAPKALLDYRILSLDMGSMLAGTKYRGDFEERMKKVLREIEKLGKGIVYIDEIHTIVGAGAVSEGSMDASNILKPFLTAGKIKFIGSTTYEEYKKYFEKDRALSRRFQKVEISEPTAADTYEILSGLKSRYEEFHSVTYTEEALRMAAELSAKYVHDRHLPDKAIDVIDEAGACARLNGEGREGNIVISGEDIERVISLMAKIPVQSVSTNEVSKLKDLDMLLKKEIFGQNAAVDTIVTAIRRSRAGFTEGEKPVASLLFVGPTGVGKTELTKQLAAILGIPLIRFDMSEYQEKHTVARLIGAPPGYVGYDEGGLLTDAIRKTPHCVLLLDEIEKAHQDIFNVLLQIMDYATLTDNTGKKADFRNVVLIMTSNAGAREVGKTLIGFEKRMIDAGAVTREVERLFLPEFRNRLDQIVVFKHIDMDMAILIAEKAIRKFEEKLMAKNIKVSVTDACYRWLAGKGLSSTYGAREIQRVVQDQIVTCFVNEVLFGKLTKGGSAVIDVVEDKISVSVEEG
jgi:ATP-dependent Clp protease ATP-binding subunit ClpA